MARMSSSRWSAVRRQVLDRDGYRCQRCEKAGRLEVHHVTPIYAGGAPYDHENLLTLCRGCHIDHHITRRPPAEWRRLVRDTLNETPNERTTKVRNDDTPTEDRTPTERKQVRGPRHPREGREDDGRP